MKGGNWEMVWGYYGTSGSLKTSVLGQKICIVLLYITWAFHTHIAFDCVFFESPYVRPHALNDIRVFSHTLAI